MNEQQGCGLGLNVFLSRPSRDVGLVSDKVLNVSVSAQKVSASRLGSPTISSRLLQARHAKLQFSTTITNVSVRSLDILVHNFTEPLYRL